MSRRDSFSKRNGYNEINEAPITVRNDAPYEFRGILVDLAYEYGLSPSILRELVCRQLRTRADQSNWSPYPNIDNEVRGLIDDCPWFKVYDILEEIARKVSLINHETRQDFEREINEVFMVHGIGWKLADGVVIYRGPEGLDKILAVAVITEQGKGHRTAANELHEAIRDMSRRPNADPTGAIQHAIASLECVAREVSGSKDTLGRWIKNHPEAFPKPLGDYVEKIWGFSSEHGRHLVESGEPSIDEAELVLGLSATLGSYLSKKGKVYG
jgi:hypothetical protein